MIAVSLNDGSGARLIKTAKLYMCTQIHYKYDKDGHTALGVHGHGSIPLNHSGNIAMRIGLHTHTSSDNALYLYQDLRKHLKEFGSYYADTFSIVKFAKGYNCQKCRWSYGVCSLHVL